MAYAKLAWIYRNQGRLSEAEAAAKKAIELNPDNYGAHSGLGWIYSRTGRIPEAESAFRRAIELNPGNDWAYVQLGWGYYRQNKFTEAEAAFKRAAGLNPGNPMAYAALKLVYSDLGDTRLSREYGQKADVLISNYYTPSTTDNYHKLKESLDKRGIIYVCVQYPMRSLEPLRKVFRGDLKGIIFVDNEKTFNDALRQARYRDYFIDTFGGDFGHCTTRGNRLLADNIAQAILREKFNK